MNKFSICCNNNNKGLVVAALSKHDFRLYLSK